MRLPSPHMYIQIRDNMAPGDPNANNALPRPPMFLNCRIINLHRLRQIIPNDTQRALAPNHHVCQENLPLKTHIYKKWCGACVFLFSRSYSVYFSLSAFAFTRARLFLFARLCNPGNRIFGRDKIEGRQCAHKYSKDNLGPCKKIDVFPAWKWALCAGFRRKMDAFDLKVWGKHAEKFHIWKDTTWPFSYNAG